MTTNKYPLDNLADCKKLASQDVFINSDIADTVDLYVDQVLFYVDRLRAQNADKRNLERNKLT